MAEEKKKSRAGGFILMIFGLLFALVTIVLGAVIIASCVNNVLQKVANDPDFSSYTTIVKPYADLVASIPFVNTVTAIIINNNLGWVAFAVSIVLAVATFIFCGIGKKLGGKVINIFAIIFAILGLLITLVGGFTLVINSFYDSVRDFVMSIVMGFIGGGGSGGSGGGDPTPDGLKALAQFIR